MTTKNKIIEDVYLENFDTAYNVYKVAYKKDPSIRLQDVKDYLNSREDKQTTFKHKKFNSFVSKHPLYEIEIDVMDMGGKEGEHLALIGVDSFTKMTHGVVIKDKQPDETYQCNAINNKKVRHSKSNL